jgi:hypothetical protein
MKHVSITVERSSKDREIQNKEIRVKKLASVRHYYRKITKQLFVSYCYCQCERKIQWVQ